MGQKNIIKIKQTYFYKNNNRNRMVIKWRKGETRRECENWSMEKWEMIEGKKVHRTITRDRKKGDRSKMYKILKLQKREKW